MSTFRTGFGKESRRFHQNDSSKPCVIGGLIFDDTPGFIADSDGDVIFHALCSAISSVTCVPILGDVADVLCAKDGITDSEVYLKEALKTLSRQKIIHIAISLEGKRPRLRDKIPALRENIARVIGLSPSQVGITVTSGQGLTDVACGDGLEAVAVITTQES